MSLLGKKFSGLYAQPMAPFFVAANCKALAVVSLYTIRSRSSTYAEEKADQLLHTGLVMMYGINSAAGVLAQSEQFKNDPRNPNSKTQKPADKH